MTVYADSSALVTLYTDAPERDYLAGRQVLVVGQPARVEVPAALWRKHRLGELAADAARVLTDDFEADYFGTDSEPPRFAAVAVTAEILDHAARLCAAHGLRAHDAVQLSCAVAARNADGDCTRFASHDAELRRAAAAEGFHLIPDWNAS